MTQGCSEPSVGARSWGMGCSKRLLTLRGQGLQGIRAGLIRLGWIRGQGSHPMAWGGRFSCLLG